MKGLIRSFVIAALALYITQQAVSSISIPKPEFFLAITAVIFVGHLFAKSVSKVFFFLPINLYTLGFLGFGINFAILYAAPILLFGVKIESFAFEGINFASFSIPPANLAALQTTIAAAVSLSLATFILNWLTD